MSFRDTAASTMHSGLRLAFRWGLNPVMLRVLASPGGAARMGRSLVGLRYTGRKSGQPRTLVVGYARVDDHLVVYAGFSKHKVWWRNFRQPGPVDVLLDGTWQRAWARVLCDGQPGRDIASEVWTRGRPRQPVTPGEPLVDIKLAQSPDGPSI